MSNSTLLLSALLILFNLALSAAGFFVSKRFIKGRAATAIGLILACILILPYLASLSDARFHFWFDIYFLPLLWAGYYFPFLGGMLVSSPVWLGLGLLGGIVTKFLTKDMKKNSRRALLITTFGFLIVFLAEGEFSHRVIYFDRPVSVQCQQSDLHLKLGEKNLAVPANLTFVLQTGSNYIWTKYTSVVSWFLRELCDRAGNSKHPLSIVWIGILFDATKVNQSRDFVENICALSQDAAGKLLCDAVSYHPTTPNRLRTISLIIPAKVTIYGQKSDHYANFVKVRDEAAKTGKRWVAEPLGIFDKYPEGYYVAKGNYFPLVNGNPEVLHCKDAEKVEGWLDCSGTEDLTIDTRAEFGFITPPAELEQTAIAAHHAAKKFFTLLSSPSQ